MSYTIVADVCEGLHDCVPVCPVDCIHHRDGQNAKGTSFVVIDPDACTKCGICLSICPIEGAILDEWKPELQTPAAGRVVERPPAPTHPIESPEQQSDQAPVPSSQPVPAFGQAGSAQEAYRLGKTLVGRQDTAGAIAAFRRALTFPDSPHQPLAAITLAILLDMQRDAAGAAAAYRRALESLHTEHAALATHNLAVILAKQADLLGAVATYRQAIDYRHEEQSPRAAVGLGQLLEELGDRPGAVSAYRQALEFNDANSSADARTRLRLLGVTEPPPPPG